MATTAPASTSALSRQPSLVPEVSERNELAPQIFLSYSRYQYEFVEQLYCALERFGYSVFFDRETLPGAVQLKEHIEQSIRECRLGVVVLSNHYLTSKWPLLELKIMAKTPSLEILPLFYKLTVDDLRDPRKLTEWRPQWKEIAEDLREVECIHVDEWEDAVKSLPRWSGVACRPEMTDQFYMENVVGTITKKFPPFVGYDVSYVKGRERLTKEIEARFNCAKQVCNSTSRPCAIGLHGVGGLGKTTLCKLMVNASMTEYAGRCGLMEFPSDRNKKSILEESKNVLRRFTSMSETLIQQADNFDKAVDLLMKHLKLHKVFLAVDNVWEHSLEEAKRIVQLEFAPGSRVLVTSRSAAVLEELLSGCDKTCVGGVPTTDQNEALEILEASFGKDSASLFSHTSPSDVLKLCLFNDSYHPLALDAVGRRLRRVERQGDVKAVVEKLSRSMLGSPQSKILRLIRSNFEVIPDTRQHIFLDVAVTYWALYSVYGWDLENLRFRLRILYGDREIDDELDQLALDGLLRFEDGKVVVHDLHRELAKQEAASSGRFFLGYNEVEWGMLERIVVYGDERSEEREMDLVQDCPKVQVVIVGGGSFLRELRLQSMRSVQVLDVDLRNTSKVTALWAAQRLAVLEVSFGSHHWTKPPLSIADVLTLTRLQVLRIQGVATNWSSRKAYYSKKAMDLLDKEFPYAFTKLRSLELRFLDLCGFDLAWKKFPDLSGLYNLQCVQIFDCDFVEKIAGLPANVRFVRLWRCRRLKRLLGLRTLAQLVELRIWDCPALEEIGRLPSNIQLLYLDHCPKLKIVPFGEQGLTSWRNQEVSHSSDWWSEYKLRQNNLVLQVGQKACTLRECPLLKKLPSAPSQLKFFSVSECYLLEQINSLPDKLQALHIRTCRSLQRLPEFPPVTKMLYYHMKQI